MPSFDEKLLERVDDELDGTKSNETPVQCTSQMKPLYNVQVKWNPCKMYRSNETPVRCTNIEVAYCTEFQTGENWKARAFFIFTYLNI